MKVIINEKEYEVDDSEGQTPLLWVLRDVIGLRGTKYGCGIGACRACTVLLNGKPVPSCQTPLEEVEHQKVTTIEGLSDDASHPLQKAWIAHQVSQCGYCQSGLLMTAVALLNENRNPDDDAIRHAMTPVLCRCGTYPRVLKAIKAAAKDMAG